MDALAYIAAAGLGAGIVAGVARSVWRRRDEDRREAARRAYFERQKADRASRDETALSRTAAWFFPHVSEDFSRRIREGKTAKEALQESLREVAGVHLGATDAGLHVVAPDQLRTRHIVLWGRSGGGKSVTVTHFLVYDIEAGRTVILFSPERESFPQILALAAARALDVIYFAPGDPACPVTFDFWTLEPDDDPDRHAEQVTSTLKRCLGEDTIGPQSDPLLANSVALITGVPNVRLSSLQRLLTDPAYRDEMIARSPNRYAKRYFREVFPKLGKAAALPILSRLDAYLRNRAVRLALDHPSGSFTLRHVLEERKILLVDLSGLAPESMQLIGGLMTCKLMLEILRRETALNAEDRACRVYIDEFPAICGFSAAAWETLLSRARKYHASLCMAGQFPSGVPLAIRQQLAGNVSTTISFSVGPRDAAAIRRELLIPGPDGSRKPVPAEELVGLPVGQGYVRMGSGACAVRVRFKPPIRPASIAASEKVRDISWKNYAAPAPPEVERSVPETDHTSCDANDGSSAAELPGRGGQLHSELMQLARKWGEEHGFRARLEEEILAGSGRVDVVLERGDVRVAVEICLSNPPDQVTRIVSRAIAAGFDHVVVVTTDVGLRDRIERAAVGAVPASDRRKVRYVSADGLRRFLGSLSVTSSDDTENVTAGYAVRVEVPPTDRMPNRRAVARLIGSALLRRRSSS